MTRTTQLGRPAQALMPRQRHGKRRWRGWLLVLPLMLLNMLVVLGPALGSVYFAFTDWSGLGSATWVGLKNFQHMFADAIFWKALWHNVQWLVLSLTVPISLALGAAALLAQIRRGQVILRTLFFLPSVLSTVVVAQIWRGLLNSQVGIGAVLKNIGLPALNIPWLGEPKLVLYVIALISMWAGWGGLVVLYLAAMQSIDFQLYEAARMEGAHRFQEFWHVTLPGIRPTLVYTIITSIIGSFLVFDYIYILTQGGPANASEVLGTLAYKAAFFRFEAGYASAVGLGQSFIIAVVGVLFIVLRRKGWNV